MTARAFDFRHSRTRGNPDQRRAFFLTAFLAAAEWEQDPFWRLSLYQPYREKLDSKIADIANASDSSYAGAITAALFLKEFVPAGISWAHFDLMA